MTEETKEQIASEQSSLEASSPQDQSHADFPDGGARAWGVACGAAFIMFCTFGFANAFGVFQEYYQTHQLSSHSPSDIAWIGSAQVFFLFAGILLGGPLFDRHGTKFLWPSIIGYLLAVMLTSLCKEFYQFMLAQGILGGIGMGMSMSPGFAAVSQYFQKKRGAALGLAVAGSSVGGVIFPIALAKMFNHPSLGFGWTVRICGFIMLVLMIPAAFLIRARLPPRKNRLFLPEAFKKPQYVTLIFALFFIMLGLFIPIFYLPTYAVAHGMNTELAFYLTAILNGVSFFGRVIPGILADKIGRLNMLFVASLCAGILCLCWQKATSNASIIVFAALYGFFSGSIVSLQSACLAQVPEDPKNIGTYLGMASFIIAFAALAGPPINGALVSRYESFDQVSILSGVMIVTGSISILIVKYTNDKNMMAKI